MVARLKLGDLEVDVRFKNIRNVHLSVHPPSGRITISAPSRLSMEAVRAFAVSELVWIRQQQSKLLDQEREAPREYLDRESHYVWGKRYLLAIEEGDHAPSIELQHSRMVLRIRPGTDEEKRNAIVERWYREQVKSLVPGLLAKWEPLLEVHVKRFFVQRMTTRWGSCNHYAGTIRLNTELAKKPRECLDYLVLHELAHLREPTHNARFVALIDRLMPDWQFRRGALNRLPVPSKMEH
jgi:predicted metal-dependent hydrolase